MRPLAAERVPGPVQRPASALSSAVEGQRHNQGSERLPRFGGCGDSRVSLHLSWESLEWCRLPSAALERVVAPKMPTHPKKSGRYTEVIALAPAAP